MRLATLLVAAWVVARVAPVQAQDADAGPPPEVAPDADAGPPPEVAQDADGGPPPEVARDADAGPPPQVAPVEIPPDPSAATPRAAAASRTTRVVTDDDRRAGHAAPQGARALDEASFVTVIDLDAHRDEGASVVEVMAETVGVSMRSFGGLGAFTSISVRGAPSAQTEILIDGVPLSRVAFASIDLGSFDLATFDGIEIYRGGVPVALGGAALGGAVNFVTAVGPKPGQAPMTLSLAGGSYGARQARLVRRDRFGARGRFATTFSLGYAGATGDYGYFYDNGTPLEVRDDSVEIRKNNGYDQVDAVARGRWRRPSGGGQTVVDFGARLSSKSQGVPGGAGVMAERSSLSTRRGVFDVSVTRAGAFGLEALDLGGGGHLVIEGQHYADPDGEIGLGMQDSDYLTVAAGAALRAAWVLPGTQLVGVALEPRLEWFREHNRLGDDSKSPSGVRAGAALSLSDTLGFGAGRWRVVPALRLDVLNMRPTGGTGEQVSDMASPLARTDVELSPRLSARFALVPSLALKSSVGRYFRAPTLVELYGDRGLLVGNPTLEPETGVSGDLGLVFAPDAAHGPFDRVFVETAVYASRPRSFISWEQTAGGVTVAKNLGDAVLGGVELSFAARAFGLLGVSGNYTFLHSRQGSPKVAKDGKALPGRPRHELYARVDLDHRSGRVGFGAHADVALATGTFLSAGNTSVVPTRHLVGVGVRVAVPYGLSFALECQNLFDERVQDVTNDPAPRPDLSSTPRAVSDALGYPLPGRSLLFTATAEI